MAKKENEEAKTPGPLASFDSEPFELRWQASGGRMSVQLLRFLKIKTGFKGEINQ